MARSAPPPARHFIRCYGGRLSRGHKGWCPFPARHAVGGAGRPARPLPGEALMHETLRARLVAYGVAVLATGVSLLLRWPLWPVIGEHTPFLTFFPAVILSAYLGGLGPEAGRAVRHPHQPAQFGGPPRRLGPGSRAAD